jgi:hypothetical protein
MLGPHSGDRDAMTVEPGYQDAIKRLIAGRIVSQ